MKVRTGGGLEQSNQLKIPETLIGREPAKEKMFSTFENICRGQTGTLLVPGHSGMGKTSLVQWLKEPVQSKNGVFVQGKFDQFHQSTPYYAVREALIKLWYHIESFNAVTRKKIHKELYRSLGELGVLLVDLIPDINRIFEKKIRIEDNSINFIEARQRFATVIRKFIEAVSLPEHPVVMFIDDWQWSDAASMELIKRFQIEKSLRYFLLIASYRSEEVGTYHPMNTVITELHQQVNPPEVITVGPLDNKDIGTLIAAALGSPVDEMDRLVDLIREQTGGNPFHIKAFLEYAYESGRISFDSDSNHWEWDLDEQLPDGIVDLFAQRLERFSSDNRELISLAACLGNHFDLDSLKTITHCSSDDCSTRLMPFRESGLILRADTGSNRIEKKSKNQPEPQWFRFMHDRVQQAAFLLIAPDKIARIRLKIGRLLLSQFYRKENHTPLYEILEHLNAGAELIHDPGEQKKMIGLNMKAAFKAKSATAFQAMLGFNRAAFYFADELAGGIGNFWHINYEQALTLHRDLAESEFLEGDRKKAERLIQQSMEHTRTAVERAESLNILIVHYTLLAKYAQAISSGRQALAEFNIHLPDQDFERFRNDEIRQIKDKLNKKPIAALFDSPIMQDTEMLTVTKLLITLGPPCYRTHQHLWSVIVPKVVNITLDFGLVPQIGYSHAALGGLMGWIENDFETARELGDLAERIMSSKFREPSDQSVFYLMIGSSIRHWFKHLNDVSQDYQKAYDIGLQSGNLQYAAYAFGHNMYCSFYRALPLPDLIRETEQHLVFSRSRLNQWAVDLCEGGIRIFKSISEKDEPTTGFLIDDTSYLNQVSDNENIQVLCIYNELKAFYHLLMNNHKTALLFSNEAEKLIYTVGLQGLLPWPEHLFTRFLIKSALCSHMGDTSRDGRMDGLTDELKTAMEQFRIWSIHCSQNHSHRYYLAKAELNRIEKKYTQAASFYDRAIESAAKNGFLQWEGIANERAYRFWQSRQNGNLSQIYWQQAFNCFQIWGAEAKLALMKNEFQDKLNTWYAGIDSGKTANDSQFENHKDQFSQSHIKQVENGSREKLLIRQHRSASKQADELNQALERLRVETAERKKVEQRLKENEQRFQKAEKLGKVGNWEYDLRTTEFWGSDEAKRIYGFDPAEKKFTIETMENCIPESDQIHRSLVELIENNKPYHLEFEIIPVNGPKKKIIRSTAQLLTDESGQAVKVAGVIQDITQRKKEEAERQKLELKLLQDQKIKAIGTLAGGIAHDFNNILQPIIGFTEMSIHDLPDGHPVQENLRDILQGSKRAAALVRQILSFSNQGDTEYKPLAVNTIILETLKLLRSILPSNIEIETRLSPKNIYIFANATEFHEVVMNICTNAYHAMEQDGGILRLNLAEIRPEPELNLNDTDRYCCLEISDTGTGIPAEIIDKIYDPYFTTKEQGKGSGLGLSVVHGIVKNYKGIIQVRNNQRKGTTVRVYLPVISGPVTGRTKKNALADHIGNESILLVDDEPAIVKLGVRTLEQIGYRVTGKTSSVEALGLFKSDPGRFDLVITDMTMPVLLGTDLARELLAIRKDIPILICTGFSERIDFKTAEKQGVRGFIKKPILNSDFVSTVRKVLDDSKGENGKEHFE